MSKLNVITNTEIDSSLNLEKLSKLIDEPYIDPFEKEKKIELDKFKALLKNETGAADRAYKDARKAYEKSLETFVKKNITPKNKFKLFYEETYDSTYECLQYERADIFLDELMTLEHMIDDHECWIINDMFDENDEQ